MSMLGSHELSDEGIVLHVYYTPSDDQLISHYSPILPTITQMIPV